MGTAPAPRPYQTAGCSQWLVDTRYELDSYPQVQMLPRVGARVGYLIGSSCRGDAAEEDRSVVTRKSRPPLGVWKANYGMCLLCACAKACTTPIASASKQTGSILIHPRGPSARSKQRARGSVASSGARSSRCNLLQCNDSLLKLQQHTGWTCQH